METRPAGPIPTAHLFAELDGHLVDLMASLSTEDWLRPTIVPQWNVHQIAAHLLDTALRRLSICRDGWSGDAPQIASERELIDLVNRLNAQGVETYGRLSPAMLIALMALTTKQLAEYLESLGPDGRAAFTVSWAGEDVSRNWFDIAREFTERWHHQQQIRLAVERPGIMTRRLYTPVLDTFMRAVPRTYRRVTARPGTVIAIEVAGDCGGEWRFARNDAEWTQTSGSAGDVAARVIIPEEIAWRIFTKGIAADDARRRVTIEGDDRLGSPILHALAIVG